MSGPPCSDPPIQSEPRRHLPPPGRERPNSTDGLSRGTSCSVGEPALLNDELLMTEFSMLFSASHMDVLHCDFPTVLQYSKQHAIQLESWTHQDLRSLIVFHLVMGMCAFGKGVTCTAVTGKTNQSCLMDMFVKLIVAHCQSSSFTSDAVRFICNVIGLRVPTGLLANDSVHILVSAHEALCARSLTTFDLLDFLTSIHNSSQHNLLFWCLGHGIYCKAFWTLAVIKDTLITHIIQNDCSSCWFSSPDHGHAPGCACLFCDDVALQIRPSHPNADHTAFFLSLTCLSPGVHASTLKSILDIARGYPHVVGRALFVQEELKAHIYSIHKGKLVYQSVLQGLLKNECQLTELNHAANLWPLLTKQPLHAWIKDLFETQIIANSTFSITCASCSVRYMSQGLTRVPLSDIDLAILEMPDGWVPLRLDRSQHGPLMNLLLDKNGVFNVRNDAIELTLCTHCCCMYCSCTNSPN